MHPVLVIFGTRFNISPATFILGYAVGAAILVHLGLKDGRTWRDMLDVSFVLVYSAVLGAKGFHLLFESAGLVLGDGVVATGVLDVLRADPWRWARFFDPGYVFYGGVVLGIGVTYLYTAYRGFVDNCSVGDYAAPGFALGIVIGRIGCFCGGCCYGKTSDVPWGVVFPRGHPSGGAHVHPVQLYDVAFGLVALAAIVLLYRRRRFGGEAFCGLIVAYSIWRFISETFRGDVERGLWFGNQLSTSQLVSLTLLPLTLFFWLRALRLRRLGKLRDPQIPIAVPGSRGA